MKTIYIIECALGDVINRWRCIHPHVVRLNLRSQSQRNLPHFYIVFLTIYPIKLGRVYVKLGLPHHTLSISDHYKAAVTLICIQTQFTVQQKTPCLTGFYFISLIYLVQKDQYSYSVLILFSSQEGYIGTQFNVRLQFKMSSLPHCCMNLHSTVHPQYPQMKNHCLLNCSY